MHLPADHLFNKLQDAITEVLDPKTLLNRKKSGRNQRYPEEQMMRIKMRF